jgi:hypothetical protein
MSDAMPFVLQGMDEQTIFCFHAVSTKQHMKIKIK